MPTFWRKVTLRRTGYCHLSQAEIAQSGEGQLPNYQDTAWGQDESNFPKPGKKRHSGGLVPPLNRARAIPTQSAHTDRDVTSTVNSQAHAVATTALRQLPTAR